MDALGEKPQYKNVLKWALIACAAVFIISFIASGYITEYLMDDLASRGVNPFSLNGYFSLGMKVSWYTLLLTALIGGSFAAAIWLMKKWAAASKLAVLAPVAGLTVGCAAGALISRTAFESIVHTFDSSITPAIGIGGYISFLFKFTLFTGISTALFVLFASLFFTAKWRFRVLYLLPALAIAFYYYIWTFPLVY